MTVWNLKEFSELEERVLTPYEISQAKRYGTRKIVSATQRLVGIVVTATAITMSMSILVMLKRSARRFPQLTSPKAALSKNRPWKKCLLEDSMLNVG